MTFLLNSELNSFIFAIISAVTPTLQVRSIGANVMCIPELNTIFAASGSDSLKFLIKTINKQLVRSIDNY